MTDELATPVMKTSEMKSLLPKNFEAHDVKGGAASYISGLWLHNGQLVIGFGDRKGQNQFLGKSRVETALRKDSITFEQVEVQSPEGSSPGLAIPAAFVARARNTLAKVPALEQPDNVGALLLDAVENAVKVAEEIAMNDRVSADLAAQNAEKKAEAAAAAVKVELPAASFAEEAKKGKAAGKGAGAAQAL